MADEETTTTEDDQSTDTETTDATTEAADEVAKWKALARKHEKEAKRLKAFEAKANEAQEQSKTDAEKAVERAKAEAAEAAGKEATAKANARILKAEIRAAAAGKLADPADALRLLDLDEFEVDDDGEVDDKAIAKAIDGLLKSKPYLSAAPKTRGSADNGARTASENSGPMSAHERLKRAYANK